MSDDRLYQNPLNEPITGDIRCGYCSGQLHLESERQYKCSNCKATFLVIEFTPKEWKDQKSKIPHQSV